MTDHYPRDSYHSRIVRDEKIRVDDISHQAASSPFLEPNPPKTVWLGSGGRITVTRTGKDVMGQEQWDYVRIGDHLDTPEKVAKFLDDLAEDILAHRRLPTYGESDEYRLHYGYRTRDGVKYDFDPNHGGANCYDYPKHEKPTCLDPHHHHGVDHSHCTDYHCRPSALCGDHCGAK